jgi:hypothetical protein
MIRSPRTFAVHPIAALATLVGLLLLGGCQRTVFENAPGAAELCDPALAGRWLSRGDDGSKDGELEAQIDADCTLVVIESKADGPRRSEPTRMHTARIDGVRYLWLDAGWANRSFEITSTTLDHEHDIYLFAYRNSRSELRLAAPPHRALAHRVLDKDIAGGVLMHGDDLTIRVDGEPDAIRRMLRKHRLFRFDGALRFRKVGAGASQ